MGIEDYEKDRHSLTPDDGFNLVGIDPFTESEEALYIIQHFEMYKDALAAKKDMGAGKYFILYKGAQGEYCHN